MNKTRSHRKDHITVATAGCLIAGLIAGCWYNIGSGFLTPPSASGQGSFFVPSPVDRLLAVLTPAAWAFPTEKTPTSMLIENFENVSVGGFPKDWKAWRGDDQYARKLYAIREENGNRYLGAQDDGTSIIIRKELNRWNPREYPILSWRWRARALPQGGDERTGPKNDSAVAVYVVLDQNFLSVPKTLKYVWSTTVPVGTRHRRDGVGRPHVIVLESGPAKVGQWVTERVNVYEEFVRTFGKPPPTNAIGIGILTDNNATKSTSEGDYDDFTVHRKEGGP